MSKKRSREEFRYREVLARRREEEEETERTIQALILNPEVTVSRVLDGNGLFQPIVPAPVVPHLSKYSNITVTRVGKGRAGAIRPPLTISKMAGSSGGIDPQMRRRMVGKGRRRIGSIGSGSTPVAQTAPESMNGKTTPPVLTDSAHEPDSMTIPLSPSFVFGECEDEESILSPFRPPMTPRYLGPTGDSSSYPWATPKTPNYEMDFSGLSGRLSSSRRSWTFDPTRPPPTPRYTGGGGADEVEEEFLRPSFMRGLDLELDDSYDWTPPTPRVTPTYPSLPNMNMSPPGQPNFLAGPKWSP